MLCLIDIICVMSSIVQCARNMVHIPGWYIYTPGWYTFPVSRCDNDHLGIVCTTIVPISDIM